MAKGQKSIPYADMGAAVIVVNTLILEGKLQLGNKGNIEATKAFYDVLADSKNADAGKFIDVLKKGREIFKDRADVAPAAPAAPAPKAEKAPVAPAPEKQEGPKYNFESCTAVLHKAQALVAEGKDLSTLSKEEQELVHIAPAERPHRVETVGEGGKKAFVIEMKDGKPVMEANPLAGKVGFTKPVLDSIKGVIRTYPKSLEKRGEMTVNKAETMTKILASAEEALATAKASMGIEVTTVEPAKELAPENA